MESTEATPRTLSTGEAAKLVGVEADTVLKWIKRGWLAAVKTPGGHHRVNACDLERLILLRRSANPVSTSSKGNPPLRCWEYFSRGGTMPEACAECVVYRVRAAFCFEMVRLKASLPHARQFCPESCDECSYFRRAHGRQLKVLVATSDPALAALDERGVRQCSLEVRLAGNAYSASAEIERFRPDFAVVDKALGAGAWRDLVSWLANDSRAPGLRIVLAVAPGEKTVGNPAVTQVIEKPFTLEELCRLLEANPPVEVVGEGAPGHAFQEACDTVEMQRASRRAHLVSSR